MNYIIPSFLRGIVSDIMNVLLLLTLLQPKYSKRVTCFAMIGMVTVDMVISLFCYRSGNLTLLAKIDFLLFAILCLAMKPLFRDKWMQWLFSYITSQNVYVAITVLSFTISRVMPYPIYSNTIVRFFLFSGVIFIMHRYGRPMYRQIVERWNVFFYVAAALYVASVYYVVRSKDIVNTLTNQADYLYLLILIGVASYISIYYCLKKISSEYALREENMEMQSCQELLHLSASAMEERLKLMDEATQQSRIAAHDRRHFNNTLLELLQQGQTDDAIDFLKKQVSIVPSKIRKYCENMTINATVCYYVGLAEQKGINADVNLDISNSLTVDSLELAMVIANLMENAIHSCEELEKSRDCYIHFTCRHVGRLALEISNPYADDIHLDENGYPIAKEDGHGIGTKSVLAFAAKHNAEVMYFAENSIFRVRMLI